MIIMINDLVRVSLFGLCFSVLYIGYLFYDKNEAISVLLLLMGSALTIIVIVSEIQFKKRRHQAPWLFR